MHLVLVALPHFLLRVRTTSPSYENFAHCTLKLTEWRTGIPLDARMQRECHGVRRQSECGDGAFGRAMMVEQPTRLVRTKAVSRCACHRSP